MKFLYFRHSKASSNQSDLESRVERQRSNFSITPLSYKSRALAYHLYEPTSSSLRLLIFTSLYIIPDPLYPHYPTKAMRNLPPPPTSSSHSSSTTTRLLTSFSRISSSCTAATQDIQGNSTSCSVSCRAVLWVAWGGIILASVHIPVLETATGVVSLDGEAHFEVSIYRGCYVWLAGFCICVFILVGGGF
jgi:hypothetical protein